MEISPASISPAERRGRLLRVLGVGFGLAVIIGNTIGAGIFRAPGEIAGHLPNAWLFLSVWIAGGLYALLGAVSLAELGAMIPRSGGQYVFARYALGEYAGFIVGWSDWISTCGSISLVAMVIGDFSGGLFSALAGKSLTIAATVSIFFAILQWRGIVFGSRVQNVTSLIKTVAFFSLIAAAFIWGGKGAPPAPAALISSGPVLLVAVILSLQAVIYTFDGWTGVIYFSEEVRDPGRDIPRSMFGGVLLVIGIYLLVNIALLYVLPISRIAGQEFAAGVAAQQIFGKFGDPIFRSLTIVSMLSGVNANTLMASRVLFAVSRDGLFSRKAAIVNKGGTPTVALWMSLAVALLFIVFGKTFARVISVLAFFFVANYTLSFIAVLVLRQREPEKPRPYRALGYPLTTVLALTGSVAFLVGAVVSDLSSGSRDSIYALVLLAASYPAFRIVKLLTAAEKPLVS
jgi:APA family basic amino acid/polyamine antiporter